MVDVYSENLHLHPEMFVTHIPNIGTVLRAMCATRKSERKLQDLTCGYLNYTKEHTMYVGNLIYWQNESYSANIKVTFMSVVVVDSPSYCIIREPPRYSP